jgi:hypothetical protein
VRLVPRSSGPQRQPGGTSPLVRFMGGWLVLSGVGFGVSTVYALWYLGRNGELPMTPWGFRALEGPLSRLGTEQSMAFGAALVGLCVLDSIAGIWLWQGRRRGATLGLATTPLALALGAGFDLPFLLWPVPVRAAVLLSRRAMLR